MVALPFSNVFWRSYLISPMLASVFWARAAIWWVLSGLKKLFAWTLTVRLSRQDRSGSWAANALRSTGGITGAAGGRSYPSISLRSSASTYSLIYISSRYYVLRINLLLIYIVLHLCQKITKHQFYFVSPIFTLTKIFTPS